MPFVRKVNESLVRILLLSSGVILRAGLVAAQGANGTWVLNVVRTLSDRREDMGIPVVDSRGCPTGRSSRFCENWRMDEKDAGRSLKHKADKDEVE